MPTMKAAKRFNQVLDLCRRHKKFLIVSHHNPDADAAASCLAMALFSCKATNAFESSDEIVMYSGSMSCATVALVEKMRIPWLRNAAACPL